MVEQPRVSPTKHVLIVFSLLVVVVGSAITVRTLLYPKSYGEYGHFRGDVVQEAMQDVVPLHAEKSVCAGCHEDEAELHDKDAHFQVQCETCHGPGGRHIDEMNDQAVKRADGPAIRVPKKSENCLMCHLRLAARPATFPQIDPAVHFQMLHLADTSTVCSSCHNPHEPLFLDKDIREARLHPVMNECIDCHKRDMDVLQPKPAGHPILFECGYCHGAISKDYHTRAHKNLRCGICHQSYPVSERAGRIVTHRDPRFCLQCHGTKFARDDKAPPQVEWPQHRVDMADAGEETKVCVDCHHEAFHVAARIGDSPARAEGGGGNDAK